MIVNAYAGVFIKELCRYCISLLQIYGGAAAMQMFTAM